MRIDRTCEIPEGRNVLYMNDHHLSAKVQMAIARELNKFYLLEDITVMAFEQPYGTLPNYVEKMYASSASFNPVTFISRAVEITPDIGAIHLVQVFLQRYVVEGRVEMWGVENQLLFDRSQIPQKEYCRHMEMWKSTAEQKKMVPENLPTEWQHKKDRLERRIHEFSERRDIAIVENIEHLMTYKNLSRLPLVRGHKHFESIKEKLRLREIGTVSYLFDP